MTEHSATGPFDAQLAKIRRRNDSYLLLEADEWVDDRLDCPEAAEEVVFIYRLADALRDERQRVDVLRSVVCHSQVVTCFAEDGHDWTPAEEEAIASALAERK